MAWTTGQMKDVKTASMLAAARVAKWAETQVAKKVVRKVVRKVARMAA